MITAVNRYRFLFEQMVRRELRQRYKGSALGVLWYLVNPLLLMGTYTLIFSLVLGTSRSISDYPLFLIIGILVWTFFSQSLLSAATSLVEHSSLVRKVRFPRETIPSAVVTVQLITFVGILGLLAPVAVAIRGTLTAALVVLPVILALLFVFVVGLSLTVATLHAHFRDVAPILSAVLLPWFFVSPIFFRPHDVPGLAHHRWVGTLLAWGNPVAPFIEAVRSVLYDGRLPSPATWGYILVAAVVSVGLGRAVFRAFDAELAVVL